MNYLANKVIWLTGASSGIGETLAQELAKRGAIVALTSRRAEVLNQLAHQIAQGGFRAHVYPGDVTNQAALCDIASQIRKDVGEIDIVIANAGTHLFTVPEKFSSEEYLYLMNTNYGGMLHCIEAVLPRMIERKSGHVVALASLAGYRGLPRAAAYGASKAAMINFLESLRFHLFDHGIPVTIVCPGFVRTPLTDKNDFHMPFLIDAERSAQIIADGIERRRKEISFPRPFNWILKLARILPYWLYELIIFPIWRAQGKK